MSTKQLLSIICLLVIGHLSYAQESNIQKFKKLEWLVGKWTRTNAKPGQSGYETWDKISELKLKGKGVTLKGTAVVFVENLEFIVKGNDIFYTVVLSDEKKLVYFKLTSISDDAFICENPTHDFPKKISYSRKGDTIKAVISGGGKNVDYLFVREPSTKQD